MAVSFRVRLSSRKFSIADDVAENDGISSHFAPVDRWQREKLDVIK